MERLKEGKDRKHHLATVVLRAHTLCERSQALMNRASIQIRQSIHLLRHERAVLEHAPLTTAPGASPPNRS